MATAPPLHCYNDAAPVDRAVSPATGRRSGPARRPRSSWIEAVPSVDTAAYADGALPGRTKELLGLTASTVLRCNDCIDYHLEQCVKAGYTKQQIIDALNVALVVGGSIVIPHLRHAVLSLDELLAERQG